jgi:hypothetical protein
MEGHELSHSLPSGGEYFGHQFFEVPRRVRIVLLLCGLLMTFELKTPKGHYRGFQPIFLEPLQAHSDSNGNVVLYPVI